MSTPALAIRRLTTDAWARLKAVRLAALADAPAAFGTLYAEDAARPDTFWQDRLARPDATTLLAILDDVDAGIVVVAAEPDSPDMAGLYSMWVAPFARGRGVGDALMEAAIATARSRGFRRLALEVGEHNHAARSLYARHGFAPSGVRGHLPPPRDDVPELQLVRAL